MRCWLLSPGDWEASLPPQPHANCLGIGSEGDKRDSKGCEAPPYGEAQATLLRSQRPGLGPEEPESALRQVVRLLCELENLGGAG